VAARRAAQTAVKGARGATAREGGASADRLRLLPEPRVRVVTSPVRRLGGRAGACTCGVPASLAYVCAAGTHELATPRGSGRAAVREFAGPHVHAK
jgi:hypothetical protein